MDVIVQHGLIIFLSKIPTFPTEPTGDLRLHAFAVQHALIRFLITMAILAKKMSLTD